MAQKTSPFMEVKYGWDFGESGWNGGMDENLLKISFLFTGTIDGIVNSLPASPVNGSAYYSVPDKRVYFYASSQWYSTPLPIGYVLRDKLTEGAYSFDGNELVEVPTDQAVDQRLSQLEVDFSSLGSAAFRDEDYFTNQEEFSELGNLVAATEDAIQAATVGTSNPQLFNGGDSQKLQQALDLVGSFGGGIVQVAGEWNIEDSGGLIVYSSTTIQLRGATIRQSQPGNRAAFIFPSGCTRSAIVGNGQIVGPAETRTPSPETSYELYPNQNAAIKLLGTYRSRVSNIVIGEGVRIKGWDVSGIFAELTKNCKFSCEVSHCGVDGIRYYGDEGSDNTRAYIHDIGPGKDGVAPHLNCYGVTATRRQQRTNRLISTSTENPTDSAWVASGLTSTAGSSTSPYTGTSLPTVYETGDNVAHTLRQDVSIVPSGYWFASVTVESRGRDDVRLSIISTATTTNYVRAHFKISTATVTAEGVNGDGILVSSGIEQISPGRVRCWLIGAPHLGATTGNTRFLFSLLENSETGITSGATYTGNPALGVAATGFQFVDNKFFSEYGTPRVVNPPSRYSRIGCLVENIPTWVGLDTHGGEYIDFSGGNIRGCYIPFNLDEGDTSGGTLDSPHIGCRLVNISATANGLTDTGAGIACVCPSGNPSYGTLIDQVYLNGYGGPSDYGDGRPRLGRGGILVSFVNDVTIGDCVVLENCKRSGVTVVGASNRINIGPITIINLQLEDAMQVGVLLESSGGNFPVAVRIEPPRITGTVTSNYTLNSSGGWVQGGRFTTATRPTPPNTVQAHGAWIFDTNLNKPIWWTGTNWRDGAGTVV